MILPNKWGKRDREMMKTRFLSIALGGSMLLAAGTAQAQIDITDFQFNDQGVVPEVVTGIDELQFATTPLAIFDNVVGTPTIDVGDRYRVVGGGVINTFLDQPGGGTIPSGLGNDYELTFFYDVNYVVSNVVVLPDLLLITLDQLPGGGLNLYFDSPPNANNPEGENFTDGTLVATFEQTPTGNTADGGTITIGTNLFTGNVQFNATATDIESGFFFTEGGTDFADLVDDNGDPIVMALTAGNLQFGPTLTNPSPTSIGNGGAEVYTDQGINTLGGIPALPTGPGDCAGTPDDCFFSLEDGSITVTQLPEPETLALFGLGLVALGFAVRRRRAIA